MPSVGHLFLNPLQQLLAASNKPPLLCHKTLPLCLGCEPGQVFECAGCKRLMPWCHGASDNYEDYCDSCALPLILND